jgi:hypothetical protein
MTHSIKIKNLNFSVETNWESPYVRAYTVIKHSINLPLAYISCKVYNILNLCSQYQHYGVKCKISLSTTPTAVLVTVRFCDSERLFFALLSNWRLARRPQLRRLAPVVTSFSPSQMCSTIPVLQFPDCTDSLLAWLDDVAGSLYFTSPCN